MAQPLYFSLWKSGVMILTGAYNVGLKIVASHVIQDAALRIADNAQNFATTWSTEVTSVQQKGYSSMFAYPLGTVYAIGKHIYNCEQKAQMAIMQSFDNHEGVLKQITDAVNFSALKGGYAEIGKGICELLSPGGTAGTLLCKGMVAGVSSTLLKGKDLWYNTWSSVAGEFIEGAAGKFGAVLKVVAGTLASTAFELFHDPKKEQDYVANLASKFAFDKLNAGAQWLLGETDTPIKDYLSAVCAAGNFYVSQKAKDLIVEGKKVVPEVMSKLYGIGSTVATKIYDVGSTVTTKMYNAGSTIVTGFIEEVKVCEKVMGGLYELGGDLVTGLLFGHGSEIAYDVVHNVMVDVHHTF
ncbi:hypothetical protein MIDIC_70025 [Alphaproteobacteria bacterium]